jgi:hypothetical protein
MAPSQTEQAETAHWHALANSAPIQASYALPPPPHPMTYGHQHHASLYAAQQAFIPPPPPPTASSTQRQVSTAHVPDYNALMAVASKQPSSTVLAKECYQIIFAQEIAEKMYATGLFNLNGRAMKGSSDRKFPLDSDKVHALRTFVEDKLPHGCNKEEEWHKCQNSIHRFISELRKK